MQSPPHPPPLQFFPHLPFHTREKERKVRPFFSGFQHISPVVGLGTVSNFVLLSFRCVCICVWKCEVWRSISSPQNLLLGLGRALLPNPEKMRREEKEGGFSLPVVCTAKSKADLMWVVDLSVGKKNLIFPRAQPQKISWQWNASFLHWEGLI